MAGVTTDFKKMSRDDFLAMIAAKKGKKGGKKDKNGKAVLPAKAGKAAADKGKADHSMADFATDLTETKFVSKKNRSKGVVKDGLVYRNGLIFRSGDYPDKQFSLSPNELRRAAEKFSDPLDIDLEHVPTPLDGKLGRLMAVESNEDGTELHGVVAIPKWLDAILPKHKVSASWDRAKKTLAGLALVRHPRVSDAALMAAFAVEQVVEGNATHDDLMDLAVKMTGYDGMVAEGGPEGQAAHNDGTVSNVDGKVPQRSKYGLKALQKIHDITAGRGAVCRSEPEPGKRTEQGIVHYATAGERDALQGIHDMTLSHGAICFSPQDLAGNARTMPGRWTWEYPGVKSEGRVGNPANTKAPHFSKNPKGGKKMGKKLDSVMASLERDSSAPQANYTRGDSEEMRSVLEEKARLSEENRRLRLQGIYDRAVNFADSLIAEGRAVPAERDRIIEVHVQCGTDDGFVGLAGFSEGGSRVSQFESIFAARPKHMLDAEAAPKAINELVAFANQMRTAPMASSGEGPMTPERRRQLLGLDHVGKQVLKDEDHANGRANGNGRR
jgi:hypothetical protein